MTDPLVSFVVPCYRLAHYLEQCVRSILAQTLTDLEVLIMDDCSPDDTAAVAHRLLADARVQYVRHENNLGHLANFNAGIERARGRYVWLISADDYLRRPHALERYLGVLEHSPRVSYAFCPSMMVLDGVETGLNQGTAHGKDDAVFNGQDLLRRSLLYVNSVSPPSWLVRAECYRSQEMFPLDLPSNADWYLSCRFALDHDVAYFAEPMVCHRQHALSMHLDFTTRRRRQFMLTEVEMQWRLQRLVKARGDGGLVPFCRAGVARQYALGMANSPVVFKPAEVEESIARESVITQETHWLRADSYVQAGHLRLAATDVLGAARFYARALWVDASLIVPLVTHVVSRLAAMLLRQARRVLA